MSAPLRQKKEYRLTKPPSIIALLEGWKGGDPPLTACTHLNDEDYGTHPHCQTLMIASKPEHSRLRVTVSSAGPNVVKSVLNGTACRNYVTPGVRGKAGHRQEFSVVTGWSVIHGAPPPPARLRHGGARGREPCSRQR